MAKQHHRSGSGGHTMTSAASKAADAVAKAAKLAKRLAKKRR